MVETINTTDQTSQETGAAQQQPIAQDAETSTGLNENEFKVYDRQLRLWGFEAQQKMKNSLVLLIDLTPTCTELARHLVLSGINIWMIDTDRPTITEQDPENDFLCSAQDVGKLRGDVVKNKLGEMNSFVEIEFLEQSSISMAVAKAAEKNRVISVVVQGFSTFESAQKINEEVRQVEQQKSSIAFYSVSSNGLYGFAYCDLGSSLSYQHSVKDGTSTDKQAEMQTETITDSLSLTDFVTKFMSTDAKLTWNKRRKQPGKMLLSAIMAYKLKGQSSATVDGTATQASSGHQKVVDLLQAKGHSGFNSNAEQSQAFARLCTDLDHLWGVQFNPTSSVIGSILSQEVIKVITRRDHPKHGFFVYDSTVQSMTIENMC